MTPTIEQIKEILAGAPDGATHYVHADNEYWDLARSNDHPKVWDDYWVAVDYDSIAGMDVFSASRLSDLRTILAQHEEIGRLVTALSFYAEGQHYFFDSDSWDDNVDGESLNWLHNVVCEETEMVEIGTIAKEAITGDSKRTLNHVRAEAIEIALESVQADNPIEFCENMRQYANQLREQSE